MIYFVRFNGRTEPNMFKIIKHACRFSKKGQNKWTIDSKEIQNIFSLTLGKVIFKTFKE